MIAKMARERYDEHVEYEKKPKIQKQEYEEKLEQAALRNAELQE